MFFFYPAPDHFSASEMRGGWHIHSRSHVQTEVLCHVTWALYSGHMDLLPDDRKTLERMGHQGIECAACFVFAVLFLRMLLCW